VKNCCAHKHTAPKPELSSLTGRLRREAHKVTGPRAAILDIFAAPPASADETRRFLPNYRTVNVTLPRFTGDAVAGEAGMVKRFDFGDGARGLNWWKRVTMAITTI